MTESKQPSPADDADPVPDIDISVAHVARVYDYWLGGKDNYEPDRQAARRAIHDYPPIIRGVRAQREFLKRAVGYLAGPAGIRQFLDIGTGLPAANNTHEVAQAVAAECRVVYVDNDPIVGTHAEALLKSRTGGRTVFLSADLRDTAEVLQAAAELLDFRRPVAIMLLGILQLIPGEDDPYTIVGQLLDAVPPGSWLAIAHPAQDVQPAEMAKMTRRLNERASTPITLRTHAEVSRFFQGADLLEPGVVQVHRWTAAAAALDSDEEIAAYCGLASKP